MGSRMFAAVVPPREVIEELDAYTDPRRQSDSRLHWASSRQWHLTTLFIDPLPDRSLEPLLESLAEIAARQDAFRVRLAGGGCFPDPTALRVLYLAVQQGSDELAHLAKVSRAAASTAGAAPDGTRYVPHLTLARARTRFDATRWLQIVDSFGAFEFEASELVMFESFLGEGPRGGARHAEVARFGFKAAEEDKWWRRGRPSVAPLDG